MTNAPTPPNHRTPLLFIWTHRWFALTLVVVLGGSAVGGPRLYYGPTVSVDIVRRGNLVRSVVASGHYETPFRVEIGSQMTGVVSDVLVDEGQNVSAGDLLIRLDDREAHAAMVQARGALAQAEARLRQLEEFTLPAAHETLSQTLAALLDAQSTFDRVSELFAKGAATRAALDDAQKNLDIGKAQVRSTELQIFTASPGGSDYVLAETQINQARAQLEAAESRLAYTLISAPRNGTLITRTVEKGAVVQAGKPLLVLAPDGQSQLVIDVDEKNLGLISIGQKALASADAFPDRKFEAMVSYINPAIDISRATVEVKLDVPNPPDFLRQDMTVSVDIEVARRDNVLVVPMRAVHDAQTGQPWAIGVENGRAVKRPLEIGLRGIANVELLSGLGEGAIVVPAQSGVVTGQRMRPLLP